MQRSPRKKGGILKKFQGQISISNPKMKNRKWLSKPPTIKLKASTNKLFWTIMYLLKIKKILRSVNKKFQNLKRNLKRKT